MSWIWTLLLPLIIFFFGIKLLGWLGHRDEISRQVRAQLFGQDAKPLNVRLFGYGLDDVKKYWGVFDEQLFSFEQQALRLDLWFPFFYGGGLFFSLFQLTSTLNNGTPRLFFFIPTVVAMLADWTENLALLKQLRNYGKTGAVGLQASGIKTASIATMVKLWSLMFAAFLMVYLIFSNYVKTQGGT